MPCSAGMLLSAVGLGVVILGGPSPRDARALSAAASASARPRECAGPSRPGRRNWHISIWDSARQPNLRRYCDLLGRAHAKLSDAPAAAREAANLADKILPGRAAPWVVRARANVLLRDYQRAVTQFQRARAIDPRSVEDPRALHDMALALVRVGKLKEALTTYRVLVPRLGVLPSSEKRATVLLQAASLAMRVGPKQLPEAIALLGEARKLPLSTRSADVLGMLALALDRAGNREQANALLDELTRRGYHVNLTSRDLRTFAYLADPADALALAALGFERSDSAKAADSWKRYISTAKTKVYQDHARSRLQKLGRRGPRKRGRGRGR